jgi:hypothetical protein
MDSQVHRPSAVGSVTDTRSGRSALVSKGNGGYRPGDVPQAGEHEGSMVRTVPRLVSATAVCVLLAVSLTATPVGAHSFKKTDRNDTAGLLDLRWAAVAHKRDAVVHSFATFARWKPSDLGRGSSGFIIGIDKNNDARQAERCVIVLFSGRLRAVLSDCNQAIRLLPVSKPSATTVKVTIPEGVTGLSYRWAVVSIYVEKRPCLRGCFDGVPNLQNFILHDLIPPSVSMATTPLRVWEASIDATFGFPFSVSDTGGAGVATWKIQRRPVGAALWTDTGISGVGGGSKDPTITGTEGTRVRYRVVVVDKHANRTNGPARLVYIPTDDDDLAAADFSDITPTIATNADAFGGTFHELDPGETFTYTYSSSGSCLFELVGPGDGDWQVSVQLDGGPAGTIHASNIVDGQRRTLYSNAACGTYVFTVTSSTGANFGVDAVLG